MHVILYFDTLICWYFRPPHFLFLGIVVFSIFWWQKLPLAIAIASKPWCVSFLSMVPSSWSVLFPASCKNILFSGQVISSVLSYWTIFCLYLITWREYYNKGFYVRIWMSIFLAVLNRNILQQTLAKWKL